MTNPYSILNDFDRWFAFEKARIELGPLLAKVFVGECIKQWNGIINTTNAELAS